MKKLFPLLLILALLLAACGTAAPPKTGVPEQDSGDVQAPSPSQTPDAAGETPLPEADDPSPVPEADPPALSDEAVTLDGISSYLRVTLPEGWTWEQAGGTPKGAVYALYPEADPAFKVELQYWPERFGMCGTGVSFEEYPLPDGKRATLATEQIGEELMWTLILPESPDSFTIQFSASQALYEAHRAELELLLSSLQQGVRAELTVVQPATADG